MDRATQVANMFLRGAGQPGAAWVSFARNAVPARWSTRAILIAAGCVGALFVLNALFWILVKAALVLAVPVVLARKYGSRLLAYRGSDALQAAANAPPHFYAGGALLAAAYVCAGSAGFLVAAGVCIGVYVRARLIDWPRFGGVSGLPIVVNASAEEFSDRAGEVAPDPFPSPREEPVRRAPGRRRAAHPR